MNIYIKTKNIYLETFGCQMNTLDSEIINILLLHYKQYRITNNIYKADIILFNTCSVRKSSEDKLLSRIGLGKKIKELKKYLIIGILGCFAERVGQLFIKKNMHVDFSVGSNYLYKIPVILNNCNIYKKYYKIYVNNRIIKENKQYKINNHFLEKFIEKKRIRKNNIKYKEYIRIMKGCNKFCSFCIVPYTRGQEEYRDYNEIIHEIKGLIKLGTKEIILLGQSVNHYNFNKMRFDKLLYTIYKQNSTLMKIKFITNYPKNFNIIMLKTMQYCVNISRQLHIPIQSGSNKILQKMNRGYKKEEYLHLINRSRKYVKNITITGDMIVGFPNETNFDFEQSIEILKEIEYQQLFIAKYSSRPNTVAFKYKKNINKNIKKYRHDYMVKTQKGIILKKNFILLNQEMEVIPYKSYLPIKNNYINYNSNKVKTILLANTTDDKTIKLLGTYDLIGKIINIKIINVNRFNILGIII